ncbi:MAG TPA: DUF5050 domain-containing protein [Thermoanaerobaculia bacterium]|jgi:hypothetical protein
MYKRSLCAIALVLVTLPLFAAKRRSVAPGAAGRCTYGVIADGIYASSIAQDESYVYVTDENSNTVVRVSKNGGTPLTLFDTSGLLVFSLAVDATTLYIGASPGDIFDLKPGSIYAVPKAGGAMRTLTTGVLLPSDIATDDTFVYFVASGTIDFITGTAQANGSVERVRKDGTQREKLAENLSTPTTLALDASNVYFSEAGFAASKPTGGVWRVAKGGGAATLLTNGWLADQIDQTANDVVFYGIRTDESQLGLHRVPKSGGNVATVVLEEDVIAGPHVFGDFVYYVTYPDEQSDALMRVPVAGGAPVMLREARLGEVDFVIDACAITYGTVDDTIVRVPR